jgi:hypothetical protein
MTIRCEDFLDHLDDFRRGGPDPATRAGMERHLVACSACRDALAEAEALGILLQQVTAESHRADARYFEAARARVLERIRTRTPARPATPVSGAPSRWRNTSWWLQIAAVFALGVLTSNLMRLAGFEPSLRPNSGRELAMEHHRVPQTTDKHAAPSDGQAAPDSSRKPPKQDEIPRLTGAVSAETRAAPEAVALAADTAGASPAYPPALSQRSAVADRQTADHARPAIESSGRAEEMASTDAGPVSREKQQAARGPGRTSSQVNPAVTGTHGAPAAAAVRAAPQVEPDGPSAVAPAHVLEPITQVATVDAPPVSGEATAAAPTTDKHTTSDAMRLYLSGEDARFRGQYVGAVALFERAIEASGPSPLAVQAHLRIAEIAAGPLADPVRARMAYEACLNPEYESVVTPQTRAVILGRLAALR